MKRIMHWVTLGWHDDIVQVSPTSSSGNINFMNRLAKMMENNKKNTFFKTVKSIFSKSSREMQKKNSRILFDAVKNTYVIRENYTKCSNETHFWEQSSEEKSEQSNFCSTINSEITSKLNNVNINNHNIVTINNEKINSIKNNCSWMMSSDSSQTEMSDNNIRNKSPSSRPVDIGIQTKIPICYKVYVLHKHVSSCNRRKRTNLKSKQKLLCSNSKNSYENCAKNTTYEYESSSTEFVYSDGTCIGDSFNTKKAQYYSKVKENNGHNKSEFVKRSRISKKHNNLKFKENINGFLQNRKMSRFGYKYNNFNLYIPTISEVSTTSLSSSGSHDYKTRRYNFINQRTKKHKQLHKMQRKPYRTIQGSKSRSLPSLRMPRKNRIKGIKCKSSPLIYQNTSTKRYINKSKLNKINYTNNTYHDNCFMNTQLKLQKGFSRQAQQNSEGEETKVKKRFPYKTRVHSTVMWSEKIDNSILYNEGKQNGNVNHGVKDDTNLNKRKDKILKLKNIFSNSKITSAMKQIRNYTTSKDCSQKFQKVNNKMLLKPNRSDSIQTNQISTKQNQENNPIQHLTPKDFCKLELNRKPIITKDLTFFNGELKSVISDRFPDYSLNKCNYGKNSKEKDVNLKSENKSINYFNTLQKHELQDYKQHSENERFQILENYEKFVQNIPVHDNSYVFQNNIKSNTDFTEFPSLQMNRITFPIFINDTLKTPDIGAQSRNLRDKNNEKCQERLQTNLSELGIPFDIFKDTPRNNVTPNCHINNSKNTDITSVSYEEKSIKNQIQNIPVCQKTKSLLEKNMTNQNKVYFEKKPKIDFITNAENPEHFSHNVGVHGIFSGNISSKKKTFFTKMNQMVNDNK